MVLEEPGAGRALTCIEIVAVRGWRTTWPNRQMPLGFLNLNSVATYSCGFSSFVCLLSWVQNISPSKQRRAVPKKQPRWSREYKPDQSRVPTKAPQCSLWSGWYPLPLHMPGIMLTFLLPTLCYADSHCDLGLLCVPCFDRSSCSSNWFTATAQGLLFMQLFGALPG